MRHADLQNMMTIDISINFDAIVKNENGDEEPRNESFEICLGVDEDTSDSSTQFLVDIAEAIEQGNLYGFLQQENATSLLIAGEMRAESVEEMLRRCCATRLPDTTADLQPPKAD